MVGLAKPVAVPAHPARPPPTTSPKGRRHPSASGHSELAGDLPSRCWSILALGSGTTQLPHSSVPVHLTQANHCNHHQTNQRDIYKLSRPVPTRAVSPVHSLRIQERHFARGSWLGLLLSLVASDIITWKRFNNFNTISGP